MQQVVPESKKRNIQFWLLLSPLQCSQKRSVSFNLIDLCFTFILCFILILKIALFPRKYDFLDLHSAQFDKILGFLFKFILSACNEEIVDIEKSSKSLIMS